MGITGTLTQLHIFGVFSTPFTVDIRGTVGGLPDNGNILQSVSNVTSTAPDSATPTSIAFNLAVTAGDVLAWAVSNGSGSLVGTNGDNYAGGNIWTQGNNCCGLQGPGTWYPNGNGSGDLDFNFRTVVDDGTPPATSSVPLPAGLPLLFLGIGSLGLLAGRRRS